MYIVDNLSLKSFAILDSHGKEQNALARDTVINDFVTEHDNIKSIPAMKRPYEDDDATDSLCINCSSQVHAELSNLFDTSPYSSSLKQGEYAPLTDDIFSKALVTSSIRLDEKGLVSIGATSSHFQLNTIKDSLASKIFIDVNSLKFAKVLIEDPSTTHVSDIGIISHQLRQVRSKFRLPSTYSLCRASGQITLNHT
ncbi:hypothetical protein MFLAVUS_010480 [Mucor flavus]|uniref:Uncharacterized protein n=1 Tax=Mucor flavus TaxID=439312 RepID=A0ABP9ZCU3_9FUNG